jgi:hypothetical protein
VVKSDFCVCGFCFIVFLALLNYFDLFRDFLGSWKQMLIAYVKVGLLLENVEVLLVYLREGRFDCLGRHGFVTARKFEVLDLRALEELCKHKLLF